MKSKLTDRGLKNYILDIALPELFTLDDIIEKMRKHQHNYIYSYKYRLRTVLTEMVQKKLLTEEIGSTKKVDGSITDIYYKKVWKDDNN